MVQPDLWRKSRAEAGPCLPGFEVPTIKGASDLHYWGSARRSRGCRFGTRSQNPRGRKLKGWTCVGIVGHEEGPEWQPAGGLTSPPAIFF